MRKTNAVPQITKDPAEKIPIGWKWTDALEAGDSIGTSAWTYESTEDPADLDSDPGSATITVAEDETAVRIIDGTLGVTYKVVNTITTANGHTHVRRIEVRIQKK